MNLTIAKDQLIHGLQSVQNIVSTRTTLPILSNVLLRATKEKLELTATDLDVSISCSVEAKVKKVGATTIPVKRFFGIVREWPARRSNWRSMKNMPAASAPALRITKFTD